MRKRKGKEGWSGRGREDMTVEEREGAGKGEERKAGESMRVEMGLG